MRLAGEHHLQRVLLVLALIAGADRAWGGQTGEPATALQRHEIVQVGATWIAQPLREFLAGMLRDEQDPKWRNGLQATQMLEGMDFLNIDGLPVLVSANMDAARVVHRDDRFS